MLTPKIPSPFKHLPATDFDGLRFEAVFDLPNDGTPTPNQLVILMEMESADSVNCQVSIIGRTYRDTLIGQFDTPINLLGNVLYGFARIQHVPLLVFN